MSAYGWFLLLLAANVILFWLPLVPALREWRDRSGEPLYIPADDETGTDYFAERFRQRLMADWDDAGLFSPRPHPRLGGNAGNDLQQAAQHLPAGIAARYRAVTDGSEVQGERHPHDGAQPVLVGQRIRLAPGCSYLGEIYARDELVVREGGLLRAVLCDGAIELGAGCGVLRWAHGQRITLGPHSRAAGRLSASEHIQVANGCRFERLSAPRIVFGKGADAVDPPHPAGASLPVDLSRTHGVEWQGETGRWLCDGDLDIGDNLLVDGHLIVRGNLRIGAGCLLRGSVKVYGSATLGSGSSIAGAMFARGTIDVGAGCELAGPLSSSHAIQIGNGCRIGTGSRMSSLAAPDILIAGDCTCHGSIWARNEGATIA